MLAPCPVVGDVLLRMRVFCTQGSLCKFVEAQITIDAASSLLLCFFLLGSPHKIQVVTRTKERRNIVTMLNDFKNN